jgi:hypothetical protein
MCVAPHEPITRALGEHAYLSPPPALLMQVRHGQAEVAPCPGRFIFKAPPLFLKVGRKMRRSGHPIVFCCLDGLSFFCFLTLITLEQEQLERPAF